MASGKKYARAAAAVAGMLLAVPVLMAQPTVPARADHPPITLVTAVPDDTPLFYALGDWAPDDDPVYFIAADREALPDTAILSLPARAVEQAPGRDHVRRSNTRGHLDKV